jgi:hypothetical protein
MKMSNAIMSLEEYKCENVERQILEGIVMPPATKTYTPIQHSVLLNMVEDQMRDIGFGFGVEHHGLSHDGMRYFGLIELEGKNARNEDFIMMMGVRNSLDKKFGAGLVFGNQVLVCANLCFFGERKLTRKHTPNILNDLPGLIAEAVQGTTVLQKQQVERIEHYKGVEMDQLTSDHLIMNLMRRKVIAPNGVGKVLQEYNEPSRVHDGGGNTVWGMHNAVTEVLKGTHMQELPTRTIGLQSLCDEQAQFMPALPLAA